jgi:hypothetical protein
MLLLLSAGQILCFPQGSLRSHRHHAESWGFKLSDAIIATPQKFARAMLLLLSAEQISYFHPGSLHSHGHRA